MGSTLQGAMNAQRMWKVHLVFYRLNERLSKTLSNNGICKLTYYHHGVYYHAYMIIEDKKGLRLEPILDDVATQW